MVFNLIREQALIWRVVERRDEKRRIRGKSGSEKRRVRGKQGIAGKGGTAPSSPPQQRQRNSKLTCWTCGEVGHRSTVCPSGPGSTESGGSAHARPTAAFSRCAAGEGYFRCSRRCSANITCYYGCFCCDTGRCACW